MLISRTFRWVVLLTLAATVGCATAPKGGTPIPPTSSSMEKARQAVAEAQASGYQVEDALIFLRQAEQATAGGDSRKADALSQRTVEAVRARRAIEGAKPVIARAKTADALHGDADKLLEAAEAALRAGDPARAEELAEQVRRQAENALEQKHGSHSRAGDTGPEQQYRVAPGDSLWGIAAKPGVYGDPYRWPLLLKTNRNEIQDADVIYPGQLFSVHRQPTAGEIQEATRHARKRGPWSKGAVEGSDLTFLSK